MSTAVHGCSWQHTAVHGCTRTCCTTTHACAAPDSHPDTPPRTTVVPGAAEHHRLPHSPPSRWSGLTPSPSLSPSPSPPVAPVGAVPGGTRAVGIGGVALGGWHPAVPVLAIFPLSLGGRYFGSPQPRWVARPCPVPGSTPGVPPALPPRAKVGGGHRGGGAGGTHRGHRTHRGHHAAENQSGPRGGGNGVGKTGNLGLAPAAEGRDGQGTGRGGTHRQRGWGHPPTAPPHPAGPPSTRSAARPHRASPPAVTGDPPPGCCAGVSGYP